MRALAALLCAALLLGAEPQPAPSTEPPATPQDAASVAPGTDAMTVRPPDPYFILQSAREAFHAPGRPPYVVYNMKRVVFLDDQPDSDDDYTLRIWSRTSDGAALVRFWDPITQRAFEDLYFGRYRLRLDADPGPPVSDIFEPPPGRIPQSPRESTTDGLRTIAVVAQRGDLDYRATLVGIDKGSYHLKLQPLRDEDRNRLRELWVDTDDFEVRRAIEVASPAVTAERWAARPQDLPAYGFLSPIQLDMTFELLANVPVITKATETAQIYPGVGALGHQIEMDYSYDRMTLRSELPDWLFQPNTYGAHFREAPSY